MKKVSVIMAVYNAGDGEALCQAVSSVLRQEYGDFELVICDDGSTDDTWEILEQIAASSDKVHIIHNQENRKAGYARNTALKAATGEFIAIMDADDLIREERLARQAEFLEQNPEYGFVGCRGEFFVERPGDDGECYWFCAEPKPENFLFSLPFVHASVMFRREVLTAVGGYDCSKKAVRAEDFDMLLRIYGAGYRGANLDEVLYYIRRDEQQYRRRKYRYRFHEAYIKYRGYKNLGLMPQAFPYVVKPLIVGLIPMGLMKKIQKKYYADKNQR